VALLDPTPGRPAMVRVERDVAPQDGAAAARGSAGGVPEAGYASAPADD
jgi:hypothetical protein